MIERDEVDLLLISPERLNNRRFRDTMLPLFARRVGLLVVDEAHCMSDWGHDFRPDYRRIRDALEQLRPGAAVLCTTATANDRVVADVIEQLGAGGDASELRTYRGELARSSLRLEVVTLPVAGRAARLAGAMAAGDAGLGDRLLPHEARHRVGGGVAERARDQRLWRTAARWTTRARRGRAAAARERREGGGGDVGARHGLRQARPRLRRPLPGARVGDRVLPAGRSRRPSPGRGARGAAARHRGPRHPGLLHPLGVPPAREGRGRGGADRVGGAAGQAGRAVGGGEPRAARGSRRC